MQYLTRMFFVALSLCFCVVIPIAAQAPPPAPTPPSGTASQRHPRDQAKETVLWEQLRKIAPKAVETFKAATIALDQRDFSQGEKLFHDVLRQVPNFEPALRRLSYCLLAQGDRDGALQLSKKALELNRSPENLYAYATNLLGFESENYQPTASELSEALRLAKEARTRNTDPTDASYLVTEAQIAFTANDRGAIDEVVQALAAQFPDLAETHFFIGVRLADSGDLDGGEAEIRKSSLLGMPEESTVPVLAAIARAKARPGPDGEGSDNGPVVRTFGSISTFSGLGKYFYYGGLVVAAWALGLLALFLAGKALSAKTLRFIENSDPNDITGDRHASLRRVYRQVIAITTFYYYLSQPIVMVIVLVATAGIVLALLWVGLIVWIVIIVGGASIFYMIKSLFIRVQSADPGRALAEAEAPGLWATVREVAATMQTRPVSEIRITPGTDLSVYERGGMGLKLQDRAERILILGVGVLNDFDQGAFRAVVAHEYGHFSHRDTAGGDTASRVEQQIFTVAQAMGRSGTATHYNLAFQFLRLFHVIFRRITRGAVRLQEVLADRVAVYHYGAEAFRNGLTHVVRREIEFGKLADVEINASKLDQRALQNLYALKVETDTLQKELAEQVAAAIARPTTEDDTHPSPQDRFDLAAKVRSLPNFPVKGVVWDLFTDREGLTAEMNKQIAGLVGARV